MRFRIVTGKVTRITTAAFFLVILMMVIYFLMVREKRQQLLEQEGFRILNGFGSSMNEKDEVISKVSLNLGNTFRKYSTAQTAKQGIGKSTGKAVPGLIPAQAGISDSARMGLMRIREKQLGKIAFSGKLNISFGRRTIAEDSVSWPSGSDSLFSCAMSMDDFISPLLRKEFFTGFILMDHENVVFTSFPGEIMISGGGRQKDPPGFFNIGLQVVTNTIVKDSSGKELMKIYSGGIREITIAGKNYRMFIQPVRFHGKNNFLLAGFVGKKEFTGWTRNLPNGIFLMLTVILLLILCSIPVMRIFSPGIKIRISAKEITTTWTVTAAAVFLLVLTFSAFLVQQGINKSVRQNLDELNSTIKTSFINETVLVLQEMKRYDSIRAEERNIILDDPKKKGSSENLIISSVLDDTVHKEYNHPGYKFFNSIFWANDAGDQVMLCTPYETASLSNVGNHGYFLHPDNYFRISGKDTLWYGMEPGYSGTNGNWEISFSSLTKDHSAFPNNRQARIVAMTSSMYSLKNTILPKEYEFCLIGKTGKAWYHSGEKLGPGDNFLDECNGDSKLLYALQNGRNVFFDGMFLHGNWKMFVSPVSGTDLFLVTMMKPSKTEKIGTMAVLLTTFIFIAVFLVFVILVWLAYLLIKNIFPLRKRYSSKQALIPGREKAKRYQWLVIMNSAVMLGFISMSFFPGFFFHRMMPSILVVAVILVIQGIVIFLVLGKKMKDEKTRISPTANWLRGYRLFVAFWIISTLVISPVVVTNNFYRAGMRQNIFVQEEAIASECKTRTEDLHNFYSHNIPSQNGYRLFLTRNDSGFYAGSVLKLKLRKGTDQKLDSILENRTQRFHPGYAFSDINCFCAGDSLGVCKFSTADFLFPEGKKATEAYLIAEIKKSEIFRSFFMMNNGAFVFSAALALLILCLFVLVRKMSERIFLPVIADYQPDSLKAILEEWKGQSRSIVIISPFLPDQGEHDGWVFVDFSVPAGLKISGRIRERGILINFGAGMDQLKILRRRVRKLEKFMQHGQAVLLLHKTPGLLIRDFSSKLKNLRKEKQVTVLLQRFDELTKELPVVYAVHPVPEIVRPEICPGLNNLLNAERRFNPHLEMEEPLLKIKHPECWDYRHEDCPCNDPCPALGDIIQSIGHFSLSWYDFVWSSLSNQEQALLRDIAGNFVLRIEDKELLMLLADKGIIEIAGGIRIISPSFLQFILKTYISEDNQSAGVAGSSRSTWKAPLLLVAAGILVFLFITQQSVLSNLASILVSIATISGVFLKLSGIIFPSGEDGSVLGRSAS
jgi:hypothetical protein